MMSRPLPLETCAPGSTGLLISRFFCKVRTLAGRLAYYRPAGAGFAPR